MRQSDRIVMCFFFVLLILLTGWTPAVAQEQIDWEGLPAGTFLCGATTSPGACTTIQSAAGDSILIDGFDPSHGLDVNAAMIFDSNNPTGGDPDLGSPNETCDNPGPGVGAGGEKGQTFENCPLDVVAGEPLDNVLIVSEDLDPSDPDDSQRRGTQITVDFSQLEGVVTLFSISLLDLEQDDASVQIFDGSGGLLFENTPLPTGDNGLVTIPFNGPDGISGVATMVVVLNGSASIDTIIFLQEPDEPLIDIRKQAEGQDTRTFPTGSDVTFEIVVTNIGDTPLTNIVVTDAEAPECANDAIPDLAPGASFSYDCTVPMVTSSFENVACVQGTDPSGVVVEDCDPSTVEIIDIDIRKQAEGPDSRTFPPGSDVTFDIVVTNTGDEDLVNVVVTDPLVPGCDRVIGDLAAGETFAYSCTAPNVTASFTNEACVTGERNGVSVGDCDPSTVVIEAPGCTHTWGYWKTHSEYGPAPYDNTWALLPNGADTPFFGTGLSYYGILQTSSAGGNKYIGLAHQYIAAELNVLSGASIPPVVLAGWLEAQALLIKYQAQLDIPKRSVDRRRAVQLAMLLDSYNNGLIGPGHCP